MLWGSWPGAKGETCGGAGAEKARHRLLTIAHESGLEIVCPACQGELTRNRNGDLSCVRCGARFPFRAKVDVLLNDHQWLSLVAQLEREKDALDKYTKARRQAPL